MDWLILFPVSLQLSFRIKAESPKYKVLKINKWPNVDFFLPAMVPDIDIQSFFSHTKVFYPGIMAIRLTDNNGSVSKWI